MLEKAIIPCTTLGRMHLLVFFICVGIHSTQALGGEAGYDVSMETHQESGLYVWFGHNFTSGVPVSYGNL